MEISNTKKALIATIGFCLFNSLQIVLQQLFVKSSIHPLHLLFLSNLSSFILFSIYLGFFGKKHLSFKINLGHGLFWWILLSALLWTSADLSTIFGLTISSSINFSIISRLQIIPYYLFTIIFFKEYFSANKILAAILSLIGGLILVYNPGSNLKINPGDLLFLLFAILISLNGLSIQKITRSISSFQLTYWLFGLSSLILGIVVFIFLPIQKIDVPGYIILNSLISIVAFNLVSYAISAGGAVFFCLTSNLLPLFTIIFSFFILKQLPLIHQIAGGLIVIASIFIFQKFGRKKN